VTGACKRMSKLLCLRSWLVLIQAFTVLNL